MKRELMELRYEFSAPQQIVFGWGRRREIGPLAATLGRRAVIVAGRLGNLGRPLTAELSDALRAQGIDVLVSEPIVHEPEVADVDRLVAQIRRQGVRPDDFLLAIGGGAAMDLAKAVAAIALDPQDASVRDYLEGVGRGLKISRPPLGVLAVPTTAGSGAEATYNAVISCSDPPVKKSLRDPRILPRIALVDPELTLSVPPAVTAASGMDAVTQLIESYLSRRAQPIPQPLAVAGLKLAMGSLAEAVEHGDSRPARECMAQAALLSGMALGNSGLGMAHGVAAALGIHARVPHGLACAVMLPVALRTNRPVCEAALAELSRAVFGPGLGGPETSNGAAAQLLIDRIESLCRRVGVPERLRALGVRPEQIPVLVQSSRGASMSGNPRELSDAELTRILEDAL
jgi:alcohol dehydrogenase class IV